jgi:hypothetical protein
MIKFLFYVLISSPFYHEERPHPGYYQNGSVELCCLNADTIPRRKNSQIVKKQSFPDGIDQDNLLKAEINASDSSIWIRGDIKRDYRIFGYEQPNIKSKPLILFSAFTRDVDSNPYKCMYGAFYSTSDLAFEDVRIKFKGFRRKFVKAHLVIEGKVVDTFYFERKWVGFAK